jgi:hypothetical protein
MLAAKNGAPERRRGSESGCDARRLSSLFALEGHYAGARVGAQFGAGCGCATHFFWVSANGAARFPADAGDSQQSPGALPRG